MASGRKVGCEGTKAPSWNPVLRSALSDVKRRCDCRVMYEHIVTVALQCGTVAVSARRTGITPPAPPPAHGTCPTFRGLSVRRTAVSELGRFISSQLDHVHNRSGAWQSVRGKVSGYCGAGWGFQVCSRDIDSRDPYCPRATTRSCSVRIKKLSVSPDLLQLRLLISGR